MTSTLSDKTPTMPEPVAWMHRDNDDEAFVVSINEPEICWQKRPLYSEAQMRAALDRAERADGEIAKIAIHLDAEFDSDSILHTIREIQADLDIFKDRATTAEAALERMRIALHDAIARPMGVVPESAEEFYDQNHPSYERFSPPPGKGVKGMSDRKIEPMPVEEMAKLKAGIEARWDGKPHYDGEGPLGSPGCMMRAREVLGLIAAVEQARAANATAANDALERAAEVADQQENYWNCVAYEKRQNGRDDNFACASASASGHLARAIRDLKETTNAE